MPIRFATETCAANAPAPRSSVRHSFGILRTLFLLGFAAFLLPALYAQVYSGSLTGVVKDPSGAVVPGARAVLTDEEKLRDEKKQLAEATHSVAIESSVVG